MEAVTLTQPERQMMVPDELTDRIASAVEAGLEAGLSPVAVRDVVEDAIARDLYDE